MACHIVFAASSNPRFRTRDRPTTLAFTFLPFQRLHPLKSTSSISGLMPSSIQELRDCPLLSFGCPADTSIMFLRMTLLSTSLPSASSRELPLHVKSTVTRFMPPSSSLEIGRRWTSNPSRASGIGATSPSASA
jgi:hypothetical protein